MPEIKTDKKTALYIGRFQPFHNGHLAMVKHILSQPDISQLIIVIGSAQYSHLDKNPFTAGERYQMISNALYNAFFDDGISEERILDYVKIIPIDDAPDANLEWRQRVITHCPEFDVVYSNQSLVCRLFKEAGYPVVNKMFGNRRILSGTTIRNMINHCVEVDRDSKDEIERYWWMEGNTGYSNCWKELVPREVAEEMERIDGINRIRDLQVKDC